MSLRKDPIDDENDLVAVAIAEYLEAIDQGSEFDQAAWLNRYEPVRQALMDFIAMEMRFSEARTKQHVFDPEQLEETIDVHALGTEGQQSNAKTNHLNRSKIGPYTLRRLLGSGGMGTVYEAIDTAGNHVAVKVLSSKWLNSPESLQRFKQEGRIASSINHPRCVFVKAADEDHGIPYLVMELMTGKTLKDLVRDHGPLSMKKALPVLFDILDALEETHTYGLIHRDLKPSNCYLESNGRVKLGDFGLARSIEVSSDLTIRGEFVGTPLFASPEQIKGEVLDVRSDIYSVCATFYFLLTGQAPFAGSSSTTLVAKIVSEDPIPVRKLNPQVPVLLEHVIMRGLARDRGARYQSVIELRQALEPFLLGRASFAAWGRRLTAYVVDFSITGMLVYVLAMMFFPVAYQQQFVDRLSIVNYVLLLVPVLCYWFGFEFLGKVSPGKWLLSLQIVDCQTGTLATRSKLFLRTLVAVLLGSVTDILLLLLISDSVEIQTFILLQSVGYLLTFGVAISPLLFSPRFRMLFHDWLSQTTVVNRTKFALGQMLARAATDYKLPELSAVHYPKTLGDFEVNGLLCFSATSAVLAGRDARLNRSIWILLRPITDRELPQSRRHCDRATRVRWLTSGFEGKWRWDAFLAFHGAPLKVWASPEAPLDWQTTRGILFQLAQELEQGELDDSQVALGSMEQVWMDSRGRVAIIDWCTTNFSDDFLSYKTTQKNKRGLLCETARLALCGTNLPLSEVHPPIAALVPLHVRKSLESLSDPPVGKENEDDFSVSGILKILEEDRGKPAAVTFENRMLGCSILFFPAIFVLGQMVYLSRLGSYVAMNDLNDKIVAPVVVDWLLEGDNLEKYREVNDLQELPSRDTLVQRRAEYAEKQRTFIDIYKARVNSFNMKDIFLLSNLMLSEDPERQLQKIVIQWNSKSNQLEARNWTIDNSIAEIGQKTWKEIAEPISDRTDHDPLQRNGISIILFSMFPFGTWLFLSFMTGANLTLRLSGQAIVWADGRPVPIYIRWLRLIIASAPFFALQFFIAWIDCYRVDYLWMLNAAGLLLYSLFLLYAVSIVVFPRRAPHDRILGTYLVPR